MQWRRETYWSWLEREGPKDRITGKYLFFAKDWRVLQHIAESEIEQRGFFLAKISNEAKSGDYVLCLYWFNDTRKKELADRYCGGYGGVKYRYWKSEEATERGEYSREFLDAAKCPAPPCLDDLGDIENEGYDDEAAFDDDADRPF